MTFDRMMLLITIAECHLVEAVRFTTFSMLQEARPTMDAEQAAVFDEWDNMRRNAVPPFVVA